MKLSKLFQIALVGAAALGVGTGGALAVCTDPLGGFAVFQCADLGYFAPAPFPIVFGTGDEPLNVEGVFWQIGFGNHFIDDGAGTTGTGNSTLKTFNGNDMGIAPLDLVDATLFSTLIPSNTVCIRVANWGNAGIDGCCDNPRSATQPFGDDDILNPYYHVQYYRAYSYDGYYSLDWQQDYPMAVLLTSLPDREWFALGAVATVDRGNVGGNGPCDVVFGGGTNDAACDHRAGHYALMEITTGLTNDATGNNDVIPWQPTPRPRAACVAGCSGSGTRTVDFTWDPVVYAHDVSARNSTNLTLTNTTDLAGGVGVKDLLRKNSVASTGNQPWYGLVKFDLQQAVVGATDVDPNGDVIYGGLVWSDLITGIVQPTSPITGNPTAIKPGAAGVAAPVDTCYRVKVKLGKDSMAVAGGLPTTVANSRVGKSGDQGYEVASTHADAITCIGGALVSEKAINLRAAKAKGAVDVSWEMTSELSVTGFDIIGVDKKGQDRSLLHVDCKQCTSGLGEYYNVTTPKGSLKGGLNMIRLEVRGGNPSSVQVPIE